jgi:hypothetical protein
LRVSSGEIHVALPQLYGAPAYARPSKPIVLFERPLDPDDLPIELERTREEQELIASLYAPTVGTPSDGDPAADGGLRGRSLRLRSLTGRIFRGG